MEPAAEEGETPSRAIFVVEPPKRPLRPGACGAYLKATLARALPAILQGFVNEAIEGSCQHLKLVVELTESSAEENDGDAKGPAQLLLERLKRLPD